MYTNIKFGFTALFLTSSFLSSFLQTTTLLPWSLEEEKKQKTYKNKQQKEKIHHRTGMKPSPFDQRERNRESADREIDRQRFKI
jgi:hypothetical protein